MLSDIFEAFDGLADKHGADKLKTIGDAYVVSAGALSPMPDHAAALVAMALEMVDAVTEIVMAAEAGLELSRMLDLETPRGGGAAGKGGGTDADGGKGGKGGGKDSTRIGVRIGIHSAEVVGGIIGTVRFHFDMCGATPLWLPLDCTSAAPRCHRFHFDMWGPAVDGAVLLEESGGAARVHISDATAALLDPGEFELSRAVTNDGSRGREALGIEASYFVEPCRDAARERSDSVLKRIRGKHRGGGGRQWIRSRLDPGHIIN